MVRSVLLASLILAVALGTGLSPCRWCDAAGARVAATVEAGATEIARMKVTRSTRSVGSNGGAGPGLSRIYTFGAEIETFVGEKRTAACAGGITSAVFVAARDSHPTIMCSGTSMVAGTYRVSGECRGRVFYADPCGVFERTTGADSPATAGDAGNEILRNLDTFKAPSTTADEVAKVAASRFLSAVTAGSERLLGLVRDQRPGAWLLFLERVNKLITVTKALRRYTMGGITVDLAPLDTDCARWKADAGMPAIGKRMADLFTTATLTAYRKVMAAYAAVGNSVRNEEVVGSHVIGWLKGKCYLLDSSKTRILAKLSDQEDARGMDIQLDKIRSLLLDVQGSATTGSGSLTSLDDVAGRTLVAAYLQGSELSKELASYLLAEVSRLDARRIGRLNRWLKAGRDHTNPIPTTPIDVVQVPLVPPRVAPRVAPPSRPGGTPQ